MIFIEMWQRPDMLSYIVGWNKGIFWIIISWTRLSYKGECPKAY